MNWKLKSFIQRACTTLPMGRSFYLLLQEFAGGLRHPRYLDRFAEQHRIALLIQEHGVLGDGARVFDVGTGWLPLAPIGFWMCGAASVRTVDIHRYLNLPALSRALAWMADNREKLIALWSDVLSDDTLAARLGTIAELIDRPEEFLARANILYAAPSDATDTGLEDDSIDVHYSTTVLEHIPPDILADILAEANRILRPGGISAHVVDPTDHFAHTDPAITNVNFLQFDDETWATYNDNQFAYHNRLRASDYRRLFEGSPLRIVETMSEIDPRAIQALRDGFPLAESFRGKRHEDLCRYRLVCIAISGKQP